MPVGVFYWFESMTVSSKFMVSSFRVYHDNLLEKYIYIYQFFKNEAIKLQNNEWWNRAIFSLLVKLNTCVSNFMSWLQLCLLLYLLHNVYKIYFQINFRWEKPWTELHQVEVLLCHFDRFAASLTSLFLRL